MGRCHFALAAFLLAVFMSACSGGTGPTPTKRPPTFTPVPTLTPGNGLEPAFSAPSTLRLLACAGTRLAWVGIDPKGQDDQIFTAGIDGSGLTPLADTASGGFASFTAVAGDWIVYLLTQTGTEDPRGKAWDLEAINARTHQHVALARSDAATAVEIPQPSAAGTTVVWDQLTDAGTKVVMTYDLATNARATVPLPTTVYPVRPYLDGSQLIFLDNGPDPNRSKEVWFFRTGYVTTFDLSSHKLTRLGTPLTAYYLEVAGGIGTYIVRQPNQDATVLYRIDLQPGASPAAIGPGETPMYRTDSGIVTFVTPLHLMRVYRFGGATTDLPSAIQFGFAMAPCGNTLYFVRGTPQIFKLSL